MAAKHPQGLLLFLHPGGIQRERPVEWLQPRKVKEARRPQGWGWGILGTKGAENEGLPGTMGLASVTVPCNKDEAPLLPELGSLVAYFFGGGEIKNGMAANPEGGWQD